MQKLIFYSLSVVLFSGCTFLNMLPNESRDQRYIKGDFKNNIDYDLLRKVYEGSTKEDALREWGEPWKKKSEDVWVYKFPFLKNKIVLVFENDIVVKTYGTMW